MKMTETRYEIDDGIVYRSKYEIAVKTDGRSERKVESAVVCRADERMAVCFDQEMGTVHKFGTEAAVSEWADRTRRALGGLVSPALAAGMGDGLGPEIERARQEMAEALVVVAFPVTPASIAAINHVISHSGPESIAKFVASLGAMEAPAFPPR
jgi:hypothetical protein